MFADPTSLTPSNGVTGASGTAKSYVTIGLNEAGSGTKRAVSGLGASAADILLIQHRIEGKGDTSRESHLVSVTKTIASTGDGIPQVDATANFTIKMPRKNCTAAQMNDVIGTLIAFVKDPAVLARLYSNEP
jgi:hypothetical protein